MANYEENLKALYERLQAEKANKAAKEKEKQFAEFDRQAMSPEQQLNENLNALRTYGEAPAPAATPGQPSLAQDFKQTMNPGAQPQLNLPPQQGLEQNLINGGRPMNIKVGETVRTTPGINIPQPILNQQEATFQARMTGSMNLATSQQQQATETAELMRQRNDQLATWAKEDKDAQAAQNKNQQARFDELQNEIAALGKKKIDPNKHWADIGPGGSMLSMIGLALGTFR